MKTDAVLAFIFSGEYMKKYIRVGVAVMAAASLSACATVTRGTKQKFEIMSEPSGANVELSIGQSCVTPCKLKLKRKAAFVATFTKEGYETQTANVRSSFSGGGGAAGAGNILIGGFIGAGVDASNGSLNNLKPNPLSVILKPVAPAVDMPATPAEAAMSEAATPDAAALEQPESPSSTEENEPVEADAAEGPAEAGNDPEAIAAEDETIVAEGEEAAATPAEEATDPTQADE